MAYAIKHFLFYIKNHIKPLKKQKTYNRTERTDLDSRKKITMNKSEDDKLVEEARKTVLQHSSSKSTLQVTILLSLAVAFFTFIQTISLFEKLNSLFLCLFYSFVFTAFTFITIRAFGRLIYWGQMAGLAERIKIIPEEDLRKELEEKKEKDLVPTYLYRVECSCNRFLKSKSRVHVIFHKLTNERGGSIVSFLIIIFALFVSLFSYEFQIPDATVIGVIVSILTFLAFLVYLKGIKKRNK